MPGSPFFPHSTEALAALASRSTMVSTPTTTNIPVNLNTHSGRDFTQAQLVAWLILQIWPSHIGLPVIVATVVLCNKIYRHPVFTNLCCAWIFVGIASSLLWVRIYVCDGWLLSEWYTKDYIQGKFLTVSLRKAFVLLKRPFWPDLRLCECEDQHHFICLMTEFL